MIKPRLLLAAGLASLAVAHAADLNIGPAGGSKVTAAFRQEGVEVENPFTRFTGRISYDPAKVAASTALIEIETASYDFGDPGYNEEVRKKAWFDSATYPKARFQSTAIQAGAAGSFTATGQLTLKGRVQTLSVPVKVSAGAKGSFVFDGSFAISRKAFGIGDPVWEGVVDDKVTIKFHLTGG
ncbi:MAG TPA: YceI family protein, partial [Steroidobacteraceae bacterium]|nr:YceI family protein [Steroidobacteraceae bacterium]